MTGSAKSGNDQEAAMPIPGFAALIPGYNLQSKGGEAPKGACRPLSAPHRPMSPPADAGRGSGPRRQVYAVCVTHPLRDRSPSGASPRHSPRQSQPALAQPQNRVSRDRPRLRCFARLRLLAAVKRAPRGPVLVPVDRCPRAARGRIAFIRARAPHLAPSFESALAKGVPMIRAR
jgi:hypothetical protein